MFILPLLGFPCGSSGKETACLCRRHKRCGFDPWVRKIPWRRARQPTMVFLPAESHGQRSMAVHRVSKSQTRLKWLSMHAPAFPVWVILLSSQIVSNFLFLRIFQLTYEDGMVDYHQYATPNESMIPMAAKITQRNILAKKKNMEPKFNHILSTATSLQETL